MKTQKPVLAALLFTGIGGLLVYLYQQAFGYREIHLSACRTPQPLVLSSFTPPVRLDAFIWGYGRQPVKLTVAQGTQVVEQTILEPDVDGALLWSYHGDWYADFIVTIDGSDCRLNITYRL